jgi:hypothetical protein
MFRFYFSAPLLWWRIVPSCGRSGSFVAEGKGGARRRGFASRSIVYSTESWLAIVMIISRFFLFLIVTLFFPSYSSYYVCCAYREFRPSIPPVSSFDRVTDSVFYSFFRMSSRHSTMLKEAVGVFSILILMATGEFIDTFIFLFLF